MPDPAGPPDPTGTSLTLLQRLRSDDATAWARLVHLYGPLVRVWAARKGVTGADADDVAQEVFATVARRLPDFRRENPGDTFRGWVYVITRNVLLLHHRRADRQPQAAGGTEARDWLNAVPDAGDGPDEPDAAADRTALYRRGLDLVKGEFEGRTWHMFWEFVVAGRPAADVAAEVGVGSAAVRQAKFRVLRRLREELGDLLG